MPAASLEYDHFTAAPRAPGVLLAQLAGMQAGGRQRRASPCPRCGRGTHEEGEDDVVGAAVACTGTAVTCESSPRVGKRCRALR